MTAGIACLFFAGAQFSMAQAQPSFALIAQGNQLAEQDNFLSAIAQFQSAKDEASRSGDWSNAHTASLNMARSMLDLNRAPEASRLLTELDQKFSDGTPNEMLHRLHLGLLLFRLDAQVQQQTHLPSATQWLLRARQDANEIADLRTESHAVGTLGAIAEYRQQFDTALANSRIAAALAEKQGALDLVYLWQWQAARVLEAMGRPDEAVSAYQLAVQTLTLIRPTLSQGSSSRFRREVAPLFHDLASLLLNQASKASASEAVADLSGARRTIEALKAAEVRDYFDDECVIDEENSVEVASLSADVGVIYPVIMNGQLEVLVSVGQVLRHHRVEASTAEIRRVALDFRRALMGRGVDQFKPAGNKLYRWLVAPALEILRQAGVKTLVIVPDGPLRSVPAAAFWDGNRYLIEEFAVATSLGLSLTSPEPIATGDASVLAGGLSVAVDDFPALPSVRQELRNIGEQFSGKQMLDEGFRLDPIVAELTAGSYDIVHLATHGKFSADYRDTYLQTFDGRLSLNTLEQSVGQRRFLSTPVELLVLSACETAVGDDRAALGLAGIALKAGARSAVATLWPVSDAATAELINEFYQQLKGGDVSKAEALRAAQLKLLNSNDYTHPFSWAPYLMLGNWL